MSTCPQCAASVDGPIGFHAVCAACHAYLHCCVNCRLYSPNSHNHCLSSTTEYVRDVAAGNFCEEFDPAKARQTDNADKDSKNRFNQLFGD